MSRPRTRKRPISQINVVPYIDVTLVMLVVFMMTAPLLTEGVKVDLPTAAKSDPVQTKPQEPVVVTVNREKLYFLDKGPVSGEDLSSAIVDILKKAPSTPILIIWDRSVDY
ncbi:biopolymer transport protein ExbD [Gammaproteobacteria bacterium]